MDAHCAMLLSLWAVDPSTGFAPHRNPQELLENMRSVPAIAGHDARNLRDLRREKAEAHNLQPVAGMVRKSLTQEGHGSGARNWLPIWPFLIGSRADGYPSPSGFRTTKHKAEKGDPRMTALHRRIGIAVGATLMAAGSAFADTVADFYKGKQIELIIGSGPGGGYDLYARLVASHLGRHIPGNPTIVPKNMEGAGSIVAANYAANIAPQDGSVIFSVQRNVAMVQIMGEDGPKFKATELNWIGSLANEAGVCAVAKRTGITKFEDVFAKPVIMGGFGPNDSEIQPALFNNTLGTKFHIVKGYPSSAPAHLAVQRGEVDGICQSWSSFNELSSSYKKEVLPLVQLSLKPHKEMAKLGIPMAIDFITKERVQSGMTVEEARDYFRLTFAPRVMGRPFAMAPKVPKERVAAVRKAFVAMSEDPKFLAEAERQKREVDLVTGEEIQDIIGQLAATPKPVLTKLDDLLTYKGKVETAKVEAVKHTGKVTKTEDENRQIFLMHEGKEVMAKVSGSRTKLTVGGSEAKRTEVKVGMTCTFTYDAPGTEAKGIDCTP
jgi:tripartite-type tricarboxylate transporter receptor subunit TctC